MERSEGILLPICLFKADMTKASTKITRITEYIHNTVVFLFYSTEFISKPKNFNLGIHILNLSRTKMFQQTVRTNVYEQFNLKI